MGKKWESTEFTKWYSKFGLPLIDSDRPDDSCLFELPIFRLPNPRGSKIYRPGWPNRRAERSSPECGIADWYRLYVLSECSFVFRNQSDKKHHRPFPVSGRLYRENGQHVNCYFAQITNGCLWVIQTKSRIGAEFTVKGMMSDESKFIRGLPRKQVSDRRISMTPSRNVLSEPLQSQA